VDDSEKSKDELIAELALLRRHLTELELRDSVLVNEVLTDLKNLRKQVGQLQQRAEVEDHEELTTTLTAIAQCCLDAIVTKTLDGVVIGWSPGAARLYGYSAEDIIGKPISILFLPDGTEELKGILTRIGRGQRIPLYHTKRCRKDGTVIDAAITILPLIKRGQVIGASKVAHLVAEKKHA
jgi:PAS domain S-box-containing protein